MLTHNTMKQLFQTDGWDGLLSMYAEGWDVNAIGWLRTVFKVPDRPHEQGYIENYRRSIKMNALSIASTQIRQFDGLYSLNDLHKASGNEEKHQPAFFVRLDQTQALTTEINQSADMQSALKTVNGGKNRGTYACKELVIAYAAWISPAFHLQVIRIFLTQQEQIALPAPSTITKEQTGIIYQTLCAKYPNGDNRHAAWSRFNKHFNLNEYKSLPAHRFDEALKWLGGAIEQPALPAPAATESQALPFKALLPNQRYLVCPETDGYITFRPLKNSEFVNSMSELAKSIPELSFGTSDENLLNIIDACKKILAKRVSAAENRLQSMKKQLQIA